MKRKIPINIKKPNLTNITNIKCDNTFVQTFTQAFAHFALALGYLLFGLPFSVWAKSINKLAQQRGEGSLKLNDFNTQWPFLSFIKSFSFDFIFDAIIFIAYPIGIILGIYLWIANALSDNGNAGTGFQIFLCVIISAFYIPCAALIIRDLIKIFIVFPIRKYLVWIQKISCHSTQKAE